MGISGASRLLSNNHLLFFLRNSGVLYIPCGYAPYYRGAVGLLIFLITELTASGFLTALPVSFLRSVIRLPGLLLRQPHGIHPVTVVKWMILATFATDVSAFAICCRVPLVPLAAFLKKSLRLSFPSPLEERHQITGASI